MCNCSSLPRFVIDPGFPGAIVRPDGVESFPGYFSRLPEGPFVPAFDYNNSSYECSVCGQPWHLELFPEEELMPGFAMKVEELPSPAQVKAAKIFLAILGSNGFSDEPCMWSNCPNNKLLGMSLCQIHL